MTFFGHYGYNPAFLKDAAQRTNAEKQAASKYDATFAERLSLNAQLGPHLSPRTLLNATASNASPDAVRLMQAAAQDIDQKNLENKERSGILAQLTSLAGQAREEVYNSLVKTPIRFTTALSESTGSFINNYLFERDISTPERIQRLARVFASPTLWGDDDVIQSLKYTEAGVYLRNLGREGRGFGLSKELQNEQHLATLGLDANGNPIDYSGRIYWDDAYAGFQAPADAPMIPGVVAGVSGGNLTTRRTKQPLTLGTAALLASGDFQINAKGAIVNYKGISPDSAAGTLISGGIDAVIELALDPTVIASKAITGAKELVRGAQIAKESPALIRAGEPMLVELRRLGQTINDLPSTSRSWGEINALRQTAADDLARAQDEISDPGLLAQYQTWRNSMLTDAEKVVWDGDKLSEMIRTDARWQWIMEMLDSSRSIVNPSIRAEAIRNKLFRNRIDIDTAQRLAAANSVDEYRQVFLEAADTLRQGEQLLPDTVTQLIGGRNRLRSKLASVKPGAGALDFDRYVLPPNALRGGFVGQIVNGRFVDPVASRIRRLFEFSPDTQILVNGSAGQRSQAVDNYRSWLNSLLPEATDETFKTETLGRVISNMVNDVVQIETLDSAGNIVTRTVSNPQTRAGLREVEDITYEVLDYYMKKNGIGGTERRFTIDRIKEVRGQARAFDVDDFGQPEDFGFIRDLGDRGLIDLDAIAQQLSQETGVFVDPATLKNISAATINELYNHTLSLPDWRELRAMVESPLFTRMMRKTGTQTDGQLRLPFAFADYAINKVWKPLNLASFGYVVRNIFDSQLRLYITDDPIASAFHRPFQYMRMIANQKATFDILDNPMTTDQVRDLAQKQINLLTPSQRDFISVMRAESWGGYAQAIDSIKRSVRSGAVKIVNKQSGEAEYTAALIDALRKIYTDPLERIMAATSHLQPDSQVAVVMKYIMDDTNEIGKHIQAELLQAAERRGLKIGVTGVGVPKTVRTNLVQPLDLSTPAARQTYLETLIDTMVRQRVERYSDLPELRAIMAQNVVPELDASGRAVVTSVLVDQAFLGKVQRKLWGNQTSAINAVGGIYYMNGKPYFISAVKNANSNAPVAELIALRTEFIRGRGDVPIRMWNPQVAGNYSSEARAILGELMNNPQNAGLANIFPETLLSYEAVTIGKMNEAWQKIVNGLFVKGIGSAERKFDRLPIWRQYKWEEYEKYYDLLSGAELRRAVDNIEQGAKREGMTPNEYMGDIRKLSERIPGPSFKQGRYERLKEVVANLPQDKQGASLEQLDNLASAVALRRMRETFYDMPKKLNFEDAASVAILYQFIAATRVIGAWFVSNLAKHPTKAYKIARALNGIADIDLPGDREVGPIFPNPITGQYAFLHPLSLVAGGIYNALPGNRGLEGTTPVFESQLRGLNIGLAGLPQANPLGQVGIGATLTATKQITGWDGSSYDTLRGVLLPFEELQKEKTLLERVTPGWITKVANGFSAMSGSQRTAMMTREINDAAAALYATGKYSGGTTEDVKALERDATQLATLMVILGGLSQFFGPASGNPTYIAKLKGIDVHAASLAAELQRLKEEDYETATIKFIGLFGEDALLYVTGKTKSVPETTGVLYTEGFRRWSENNQASINAYQTGIGNYFGPPEDESEFDFAMRAELLDSGKTRYMTPAEKLRASQYAIGSSYYRFVRQQFPERGLTPDQTEFLREYRNGLEDKYPGFNRTFTVGQLEKRISDLEQIVADGAFQDSELFMPVSQYLQARRALLQASGRTTFRSQAATPYREALEAIGLALSAQNKSFERLYDRVLSQETDPVGK